MNKESMILLRRDVRFNTELIKGLRLDIDQRIKYLALQNSKLQKLIARQKKVKEDLENEE